MYRGICYKFPDPNNLTLASDSLVIGDGFSGKPWLGWRKIGTSLFLRLPSVAACLLIVEFEIESLTLIDACLTL